MFHDPHNTFRPTDATEYVDAYRNSVHKSAAEIRKSLEALNARIDRVVHAGATIPTHMLAAYRGYEDALMFVEHAILPGVVKLDDTDPTPCERLTPAGYVHA